MYKNMSTVEMTTISYLANHHEVKIHITEQSNVKYINQFLANKNLIGELPTKALLCYNEVFSDYQLCE
jgi:hypothetical protein